MGAGVGFKGRLARSSRLVGAAAVSAALLLIAFVSWDGTTPRVRQQVALTGEARLQLSEPEVPVGSMCRQNRGRACTAGEVASPYLPASSPLHNASAEYMLDDLQHTFAVTFNARVYVYNPVLTVFNGTLFLIARYEGRNSSYTWEACPDTSPSALRLCPTPTMRMVSFVVYAPLDGALKPEVPLSAVRYQLPWHVVEARPNRVWEIGPEDPRVFSWGSAEYILFNDVPASANASNKVARGMRLQKLFPRIEPPTELQVPNHQRFEKNYSPIQEDGDAYLFSRMVNPHEILRCQHNGSCTRAAVTQQDEFFSSWRQRLGVAHLHLGTNAIRLSQGNIYLALCHAISDSPKRYLSFAYTFSGSAPWGILAIGSRPVELPQASFSRGFLYTSGLTWVDGHIVVSYGVNDKGCKFLVTDEQKLLRNMERVPPE